MNTTFWAILFKKGKWEKLIMNSNQQMYRKIIIDHYTNPSHKGLTKNYLCLFIQQKSQSCVDNIDLELLINNDIIEKACFDGIGCAISIASCDIIASLIEKKTCTDAILLIDNYLNMVNHQSYQPFEKNSEIMSFSNIYKTSNRIKCASIGVNGFKILLSNQLKK